MNRTERPIPWCEVPVPTRDVSNYAGATPGMTALQHCQECLRLWSHVTDTALVTTRLGSIGDLYPALLIGLPVGMRVIGGVATGAYLPPQDFAYAQGWLAIADACERISAFTGMSIVCLENESALDSYHGGKCRIIRSRLETALKPLAALTQLTIWFNLPSILEDTDAFPDRAEATGGLMRTMAASVPTAKFFTASNWRPSSRRNPFKAFARNLMIGLIDAQRLGERLLLWNRAPFGSTVDRYTVDQIPIEMYGLWGRTPMLSPVTCYSGALDAIPVAKQVAALVGGE